MTDERPTPTDLDARAGEAPRDPHGRTGGEISRRTFVSLGAGALLVALAPGALWRRSPRVVRRTIPTMGTLAEVVVADADPAVARAAIQAALDELRWVDRTMTRFDPASDVGRVNAGRTGEPVRVTAATAGVLAAGLRWAEVSGGRFDPGLARAVALWDVGRREAPPAGNRVSRFANRGLHRELRVDGLADAGSPLPPPTGPAGGPEPRGGGGPVIVRRHPDVGVDLGGIAKGYAVDRAAAALRRHGIERGMVNAGGDLYALGRSPDGDPWRVGIRCPRDPSRLAGQVEMADGAVATSGDYERYFDHGGRRYHHLLDPGTGEPRRTEVHSLTVTAPDCLTADAAATAFFGLPRSDARRALQEAAPDTEVV